MSVLSGRIAENKIQSVANAGFQKEDHESGYQNADSTSASVLQKIADNSPQARKAAQLQAMANNRNQVVQRYGALGVGNPGNLVLPANTVLTHGSPVQQFLDPANLPKATPDAPGWFAMGSRFSAHAGSRGGDAVTHLHNYTVNANLNLLVFHDINDLSQYLQNLGHPATDVNGVTEANQVLAANGGMDGYKLDHDTVRNEPEIILFNSGVNHLVALFRSELRSVEQQAFGDDADIGRRRKLLGGRQVIHSADIDDLSDFKTTGDDKTTGRARSQSIG